MNVIRQTKRGDGTTTKQMLATPVGGVYIWCNHHLDYPTELAKKLKRTDLQIVSPMWLSEDRWRGKVLPGLALDHATDLTDEQVDSYHLAVGHVRQGNSETHK